MINQIIYIIFFCISILYGFYPNDYAIDSVNQNSQYRSRELSNGLSNHSIVDLRILNDQSIVIATSGGLGLLDNGMNFYSYNDNLLPGGGNPALEVYNDENLIIVSGVETVNYFDEDVASGTGVSWSLDNGNTWNYMPQPQDQLPVCEELTCENPLNSPDECECSPAASGCTWDVPNQTCSLVGNNIIIEWGGQSLSSLAIQTSAKNVTYDISADIINKYIYTANWAGMLRRFKYTDEDPSWELVPLPMDNQSSAICGLYPPNYVYNPVDGSGEDNHKVFSVYTEFYNEQMYIWVGTASGVNKGIIYQDGCIDWTHYNIEILEDPLGGDWIIDIVPQNIGNSIPRIWLISWDKNQPVPHPNSLTYTDDNGISWVTVDQFSEEFVDSNNNNIYDQEDGDQENGFIDLNDNDNYDGATPYNLYFKNNILYASTNRGLFYAYDDDVLNWNRLEFPNDILFALNYESIIEEGIFAETKIYTCIERNGIFFIGTPNGLVWVDAGDNINNPNLWSLELWDSYILSPLDQDPSDQDPSDQDPSDQDPPNQGIVNGNKLYIWPNPYYIDNTSARVNFQYQTDSSSGKMKVYDFSMNLVDSFDCNKQNNSEFLECSWYGINKNNIKVANGVYFCKLDIGYAEIWGKLMVINATKGDY